MRGRHPHEGVQRFSRDEERQELGSQNGLLKVCITECFISALHPELLSGILKIGSTVRMINPCRGRWRCQFIVSSSISQLTCKIVCYIHQWIPLLEEVHTKVIFVVCFGPQGCGGHTVRGGDAQNNPFLVELKFQQQDYFSPETIFLVLFSCSSVQSYKRFQTHTEAYFYHLK